MTGQKPRSRQAFLTFLTRGAVRNEAFGVWAACSAPFSEVLITLKSPSRCFPVGSYSDPLFYDLLIGKMRHSLRYRCSLLGQNLLHNGRIKMKRWKMLPEGFAMSSVHSVLKRNSNLKVTHGVDCKWKIGLATNGQTSFRIP